MEYIITQYILTSELASLLEASGFPSSNRIASFLLDDPFTTEVCNKTNHAIINAVNLNHNQSV